MPMLRFKRRFPLRYDGEGPSVYVQIPCFRGSVGIIAVAQDTQSRYTEKRLVSQPESLSYMSSFP